MKLVMENYGIGHGHYHKIDQRERFICLKYLGWNTPKNKVQQLIIDKTFLIGQPASSAKKSSQENIVKNAALLIR